jgi:RimJ/RimL family protein N-acetyltransferase
MDRHADALNPPESVATTSSGTGATAVAAVAKPLRTWVPVRSLTSRHRGRVKAHLLALDEHDRYLRFGFAAADAQIMHYADTIDFDRDEVFGIFNRRLELIAMAHLAYATTPRVEGDPATAEFGVSVSRAARGRGLGSRLFDHAVLHARNRQVKILSIFALSENAAMLRIARNAGARVERDGAESEAWLTLPPDDIASQVGAVVEDQAAEWDYLLKTQAMRVGEFIRILSEVRTEVSSAVRDPPE